MTSRIIVKWNVNMTILRIESSCATSTNNNNVQFLYGACSYSCSKRPMLCMQRVRRKYEQLKVVTAKVHVVFRSVYFTSPLLTEMGPPFYVVIEPQVENQVLTLCNTFQKGLMKFKSGHHTVIMYLHLAC